MNRDYLVGGVELDLSLLDEEFGPAEAPVELAKELVAPSVTGDGKEQIAEILDLARRVEEIQKFGGYTKWFVPGTQYGIDKLHKHREFFWAGAKYHERYFSAANQVGKSTALAFETTLHATGLYPDWWEGKRFTRPISAIVAGSTNETTRNIIQKELCGDIGALGTGMIPKDCIAKTTSKSGVSNAFDVMMVKHKSGGLSTIYFKSYDQDRRAFEGVKTDWVWLDEMPPPDIYSECYTRTITRNGLIAVSATPLDGLTPVVLNFYSTADFLPSDTPIPNIIRMVKEEHDQHNEELKRKGETPIKQSNSKAVIVAGWDDAPWLTEEAKIRVLASTPAHLRQARSTGIPGDTGGAVFPIAMSDLLVDDFPIPAHYKLINGLDPGWHNTGAIFGALDPDTDTLYIYADYKRGQAEVLVHAEAVKSKSKWADAPVIFDYAGMGGRAEEETTRNLYRKYGLKLINADKSVMAGISSVWERMSTGKLKIFKSCRALQQELATYRMDETGKIIKENDHILDPLRYICMGIKHARTPNQSSVSSFGQLKGQVGGKKYFS